MTADNSNDPLAEWSRLTKQNAERDIANVLLRGMLESSPIVDRFAQWLLAGTAATAALMISQMSSLVPLIGINGFKWAIGCLIVSAFFGLLAKHKAIQCLITIEIDKGVRDRLPPILDALDTDRAQIEESAAAANRELSTEIDMSRVMDDALSPLPRYARWFAKRSANKGYEDPNHALKQGVKYLWRLSWFTLIQTVWYIAFVVVAARNASAT